jgi:ABC-type dipeptide/oligopeptide/nickel transport system permease subunit
VSTKEKPELVSSGVGLAATVAAETHGELGEIEEIRARGYWEQVWIRFRRDKAAIGGGIFIVFMIAAAFAGAPLAAHLLGHGPNDQFIIAAIDKNTGQPVGPLRHIVADPSGLCPPTGACPHTLFILGSDSNLGRDEFLRLLYGAQVSLEVALGATFVSMMIGILLGSIAGYFGGWVDMIVSRLTEIVMAFPFLLFVVALSSTVGQRLNDITFGGAIGHGVFTLVTVIGLFSWFYPARIVRASVLSLRRQEFVEAARMVGASTPRIIRTHMLPHLVGPVAVYFAIIAATNIVLESALSFLNIGIPLPDPSWGNMLATNWGHFFIVARPEAIGVVPSAWTTVLPAVTIAMTVVALSLFGEGVRRAFDPGAPMR